MKASFNTGPGGLNHWLMTQIINRDIHFYSVLYKQNQNVFTHKKDRHPKVFVLSLHFYSKSGLSLYSEKEFIAGNFALLIRLTLLNLFPLQQSADIMHIIRYAILTNILTTWKNISRWSSWPSKLSSTR